MDSDTITGILKWVVIVGFVVLSYFIEMLKEKKKRNKRPTANTHARPDNVHISVGGASVFVNVDTPAAEPKPAPKPRKKHKPKAKSTPKPAATPVLFEEGQRVTAAKPAPSPIMEPHVSSRQQRRLRAMQRLGLKSKEDLRRAIIINEVLKPKYE